jgi:hypothetical protein
MLFLHAPQGGKLALPFGKGGHGLTNQIIGGWELAGIFPAQTGRPLTPYYSANLSNTFANSDRPNVVGDPNDAPHTPT